MTKPELEAEVERLEKLNRRLIKFIEEFDKCSIFSWTYWMQLKFKAKKIIKEEV